MKIGLFGASGKTGQSVILECLQKGYDVNAFVRDPGKLKIEDPKLKIFTGDVLDPNTYEMVLTEVDAVVVVLNGLMTEGIKNILSNMRQRHVKRIILMSSYPMSGTPEGMSYLRSAGLDQKKIDEMMPVIEDKKAQEELVMESGLIWTIVRPTFLKDEPKTGKYEISPGVQLDASINGITRADVAEFIVNALDTKEWDNKLVTLSS